MDSKCIGVINEALIQIGSPNPGCWPRFFKRETRYVRIRIDYKYLWGKSGLLNDIHVLVRTLGGALWTSIRGKASGAVSVAVEWDKAKSFPSGALTDPANVFGDSPGPSLSLGAHGDSPGLSATGLPSSFGSRHRRSPSWLSEWILCSMFSFCRWGEERGYNKNEARANSMVLTLTPVVYKAE